MKLMWRYVMRYKGWLVLDAICTLGFALAELGIPTLISEMIDSGVLAADPSYLISRFWILVCISVLGVTGTSLLAFVSVKMTTTIAYDIRRDLFEHVFTLSHAEIEKFGVSSLITRTNNDPFQIMNFLNVMLKWALICPVMLVVSFMLIIRANLNLSFIVLATIPIIVGGVVMVAKWAEPLSVQQQESIDSINRILREDMTGIRVVRSFNAEKREEARFAKVSKLFETTSEKLFKLMSCSEPAFFFVMNIATVLVYYFSCGLLDSGALQIGQLMAFVEYLFHAMMSVLQICMIFMMYPRANVSAKRIEKVLETKSSLPEPEKPAAMGPLSTLEFDNVSFAYPDGEEAVLKDISFKAKTGDKIAIIGSTGSGKSTLTKLIPRFYDVSAGSVRVNGRDIRDYSLEELREQMSVVSQKAHLFKGTILSNVQFGAPEASEEEAQEAARLAQAENFIQEKPNQWGFEIAEEGTNVSGGQKQRLSIARALVRKPRLYIYDDSFSALDLKTDAELRKAIQPLRKNSIFLIIAQRVSTILDADEIIVLDEGRVAGRGRHEELLENCEIYREIANSQLAGGESHG